MRAVGVRELKNRLSEYLRLVKQGEQVLVTEHGVVIAEIRQPSLTAAEQPYPGLANLVRRGVASAVHENDPGAYPRMRRLLPEGEALRLLDETRGDQ
ncbi:MAG: type II toxin-antitoxin system Phd/YefM family antitoxin [Gemmatimonadales bacterium]